MVYCFTRWCVCGGFYYLTYSIVPQQVCLPWTNKALFLSEQYKMRRVTLTCEVRFIYWMLLSINKPYTSWTNLMLCSDCKIIFLGTYVFAKFTLSNYSCYLHLDFLLGRTMPMQLKCTERPPVPRQLLLWSCRSSMQSSTIALVKSCRRPRQELP